MGAQRTVACPHCEAPRVTKAIGRQRLTCTSCGRSWLARDSRPTGAPEQPPAPVPAAVSAAAPAGPSAGIGGVDVLPPASLSIGSLAFPDAPLEPTAPAPTVPAAAASGPAAPTTEEPAREGPGPLETPGAPVSTGPGRRLGYYGRITKR